MEGKLAGSLVASFDKALMGCLHLYVEDGWPSFMSKDRVSGRNGIRP